jgi:tRNA threonylcarbamoyladenosine biosynthesis protein TsaE
LTILETRTLPWPDEAACAAMAARMATQAAVRCAFVTLHGPLGAGKTTFTRHLLQALGVSGRIKSPTYTLVEEYTGQQQGLSFDIRHFDFYRFDDPQEWEDAGLRELFAAPGLKLAEWPDKAGDLLPPPDLSLHIAPGAADDRLVRLEAHSPLGRELLG